MKILQTISGLSVTSGGPSTCTCDLMNALYKEAGAFVDLLTVGARSPEDIVLGAGEPWLKTVPYDYRTPLALSSNFNKAILALDYDLYHCNGLWMGVNHSTCSVARKKKRPYILSPHGMLYPNALHINYWKKWPLLKLWYNRDIKNASCLHATCSMEAEHIRAFGYKGPVAVIGNAAVMPEYAALASSKPCGRRAIGFLGRLHPIKRVERLLYGLAECTEDVRSGIVLQIMGKGLDDYEMFLHNEVDRLGLHSCVEFLGFVEGEEKYALLRNLWALMVPSESENFGMIVPEALISGTPVYASLGTPWKILSDTKCGWWEDSTPENIAKIITGIVSMSENDVLEMGKRGRSMVKEHFAADSVAIQMLMLYKWVLEGGSMPSFVTID